MAKYRVVGLYPHLDTYARWCETVDADSTAAAIFTARRRMAALLSFDEQAEPEDFRRVMDECIIADVLPLPMANLGLPAVSDFIRQLLDFSRQTPILSQMESLSSAVLIDITKVRGKGRAAA